MPAESANASWGLKRRAACGGNCRPPRRLQETHAVDIEAAWQRVRTESEPGTKAYRASCQAISVEWRSIMRLRLVRAG
jgi:hypothetical protein